MEDSVFFTIAFLTFGPGLVEIYLCFRQLNIIENLHHIPPRLESYLTQDKFFQIRDDYYNEVHLKVLRILINRIFIPTLELSIGVLPVIWNIAESVGRSSGFFYRNEIFIGVHFTIFLVFYDTIKSIMWRFVEALILPFFYFTEFTCNLSFICKSLGYCFFKILVLVPLAIAVILICLNAGISIFFWLWLYFCLILTIGVLAVWPLCVLATVFQIEPFPKGPLQKRIANIARSEGFPPMEILIAKRNLLAGDASLTSLAGIYCIKRILISDDFIETISFKEDKNDDDSSNNTLLDSSFPQDEHEVVIQTELPKPRAQTNSSSVTGHEGQHQSIDIEVESFETAPENSKQMSSRLRHLKRSMLVNPQLWYTEENIEAIIIHELGHWKFNHTIKKLLFIILVKFFWFGLLSKIISYDEIYEAVGFEVQKTPRLVGCVIFTFYISGFIFILERFAYNFLCSLHEFEADILIIESDYNHQMADLLIKRYMKHFIFPIFDKWYRRLYKRNPTLLPRLEFLDRNLRTDPYMLPEVRNWWYDLM